MKLCSDLRSHFRGESAFDQILALEGSVYREREGRKTLRFDLNAKQYFVKIHLGIGWKEILKNLCSLRRPVLSARNECRAIQHLHQIGVDSMKIVGYGQRDWNPAQIQSFLITEDLSNTVSLEGFCHDWASSPPAFELKRALIEKVAEIARRIHENGINHRDFYICHFLLDRRSLDSFRAKRRLQIHLIDLHRAQIRKRVPTRWVVKDVAGLFFSSMDIGLTRLDLFRFMMAYRATSLRSVLHQEKSFWKKVMKRAIALYRKEFHRFPVLPSGLT